LRDEQNKKQESLILDFLPAYKKEMNERFAKTA